MKVFGLEQKAAGNAAAEGAADAALGEFGFFDDDCGARMAALMLALLEKQLGGPAGK